MIGPFHFVCPRDGRKLTKIADVLTHGTTHARRRCPGCHRVYVINVQPVAVEATRDNPAGWRYVSMISETVPKVTTVK